MWLSSLKFLLKRKQSKTTQRLLASMDLLSPWSVAGAEISQTLQRWAEDVSKTHNYGSLYPSVSWARPADIERVHRAKRSKWVNVWRWFVLKWFKRSAEWRICCRRIHKHKCTWVCFSAWESTIPIDQICTSSWQITDREWRQQQWRVNCLSVASSSKTSSFRSHHIYKSALTNNFISSVFI